MELKTVLEKLARREDLSRDEAKRTFDRIMRGELDPLAIAALTGALLAKGESTAELVGAAEAMRAAMIPVRCDADCIDTCGTGGDGISTFNVSTAAAIIAAGAGATVAKHGNRSTTRASGSTEVLDELGIDVDADVSIAEVCLRDARIGYLNARRLHPAMKHAAPVRAALPVRTIFNLLGPLTNPAGAKRQLIGVPSVERMEKMAEAVVALGAVHTWVVHGAGGLCDLSIAGESRVVETRDGQTRRFTTTPEDAGLARAPLPSLLVRSPRESAARIREILDGALGACRDHAVLNAGAALVVAGRADSLRDAVRMAQESIDRGSATETLERWRAIAASRIVEGPGRGGQA